jgi:hypothetical protein
MACNLLTKITTLCCIFYVKMNNVNVNTLNTLKQIDTWSDDVVAMTYPNRVTLVNDNDFSKCFVQQNKPSFVDKDIRFYLVNKHPIVVNEKLILDPPKTVKIKSIRKPIVKRKDDDEEEKRKPIVRKPIVKRKDDNEEEKRKPLVRKPIVKRKDDNEEEKKKPVVRKPIVKRKDDDEEEKRKPVISEPEEDDDDDEDSEKEERWKKYVHRDLHDHVHHYIKHDRHVNHKHPSLHFFKKKIKDWWADEEEDDEEDLKKMKHVFSTIRKHKLM